MRTAIAPLFAAVAQANVELTLDVRNASIPVKGVKHADAAETIHLTLGNRWLKTDDVVYDFDKRVVIRVRSADGSWSSTTA
jgi:hypothetical protein